MSVVIGEREFDSTLRRRIADFIDAHFEEEGFDEPDFLSVAAMSAPMEAAQPVPQAAGGGMAGVFGGLLDRRESAHGRKAAAEADEERAVLEDSMAPCEERGLESWLDRIDEPFSTTLLALIDRKGLDDVDVYKRANMSRQLFSRIRSDAAYRPAKKTVLALCIAMELPLEEMRDLLGRAGFALSRSSKRDVIAEYFVANGIYDLFAINEALYEFDQPLI